MVRTYRLVLLAMLYVLLASCPGALLFQSGERIAFLGDSITQFGNRPDGYVRLVMDGLSRCGVQAVCLPAGVSGNTSREMVRRLPRVLSQKPHWLLLSCGVNDVGHGRGGVELPAFRDNVTRILDSCAAAGVKVMILTPTMCGENPSSANNRKLEGYCEFLREEARTRQLPLADLNRLMHEELRVRENLKGLKLTLDNLHMNGYGNQMMAAGVLRAAGVTERQLDEFRRDWNRIPSMTPILNAWYDPSYKISISDYERLAKEAERRGLTVDQLVRQLVEQTLKALRKN